MATKKSAAKPITATAALKDPVRVAAGTKGAAMGQATRSVVEKPMAASIKMDAPSSVVDKLIVSIKTRGAKLDNDIHSAAMACLYHADKHGDTTLMVRLLMALPKSARRNALGQWAVKFGKFVENTDKASLAQVPLVFDKTKSTDIDAALATPFWDFKNVKEGTTEWLFTNYIEGVMKSLANHAVGTGAEAAKAKAALDALHGVNKALAVPADTGPLPAGVKVDRRAQAVRAPVPAAPSIPAVH